MTVLVYLVAVLCAPGVARAQSPVDGFDPGANDLVRAFAVQADGKILAGGLFTLIGGGGAGSTPRDHIARLGVDGTVDLTFDPGASGPVYAFAVQTDGKIVVVGNFTTLGGATRQYIGRLNADGSLDSFTASADGPINAVAVQADGKIVVGGLFTNLDGGSGMTPRNNIGRFNPDGTLDAGFNPGSGGEIFALTVQADGKVLVGGAFAGLGGGTGTTPRNHVGRLNPDGTVDSFDPNASSDVKALAVQADGKVILGGHFADLAGGASVRRFIARVNADGSVDNSFNPGADDFVETLALQPDGKIVVGGLFAALGGGVGDTTRNKLGRINSDGSVDAAFNPGASESVYAVAVQPDGDVLVGGVFLGLGDGTGATPRFSIGRIDATGVLDADFDPGADDFVTALALQPNRQVLVGGGFGFLGGGTGTDAHDFLGRINPDGSLDSDFTIGANCDVTAMTVQPDGKIVVGGFFTASFCGPTGIPRDTIARLNADGSFDATFDAQADDQGMVAMASQPDGKILVGGFFQQMGGVTRQGIARLNADGTLDTSFIDPDVDGPVLAFALQPDGKIVIGGFFQNLFAESDEPLPRSFIARLNADGSPDLTFDPGSDGPVYALALQPDGKIVVGGQFNGLGDGTGATERNYIGRINADGTLDGSFDPGADDSVNTLTLQTDGRILAGGDFTSMGDGGTGSTTRFGIARLEADGTLDPSFDPGADFTVAGLLVQPNGRVLVAGDFNGLGDGVGSTTRNFIGRLTNTGAALQNLSVSGVGSVVTWLRSGAGPEIRHATFESSIDGTTFTPLGDATRIAGGWQLTGQTLPVNQNLFIRARGLYDGGFDNGSGSIVESIRNAYVSCPAIAPVTLLHGAAGVPYSTTFTAPGAIGAVTFGESGVLPNVITFNTGVLSGTPTVIGSFPISVSATDDSSGCTTSQNLTLTIDCPVITLSATFFENGTGGVEYTPTAITESGGVGLTTFAITGGGLPAGMSLSSGGVVSGTPTQAGTFNFTVTATDANGCTGSRAYTITIECPDVFLSPPDASFSSFGGAGNATVSTASGCGWTATASATWIELNAPGGMGSGPGMLSYVVRPNVSHNSRFGTISVGGNTLIVSESGATSCQFLLPTSAAFSVVGGARSLEVEATEDCSWTASTPASWITIGDGSGTGNGTATLTLEPNTTHAPRTADVTVGDQTMPITQQGAAVPSDFDGDGKADPAIYRPASGLWAILLSSTNYVSSTRVSWGLSTDVPMPGDYDGDGMADPAIYRPSTGLWAILKSSTGYTTSFSVSWGLSTDKPVSADYDGDGKADPAVYRPSTGGWFILKSSTNYTTSFGVSWGLSTDLPMQGDYDGDGKADPAIYRPSTGLWAVLKSSTNYGSSLVLSWGLSTDVAVPGDYDADGKIDPAVFRPSTGGWYILKSSTNYTTSFGVLWGLSTDDPVPSDFDGDGKTGIAVFRASTGFWYALKSSTNDTTSFGVSWGLGTDVPILKRP